ncbi:MFS transporter [Alicyclobacillus sp. ALC3]|uniref:MFS transporter n=1 Tax=Alicyclobacillus sp. ALC3 TaxID=2796143 RepID=UPI002379FC64|nr:MFS transporter [Alicyclobacillus sp. ALC3]WDL98786.1 MFS transporter [Alicyclobacillus sp. ALC3]
MLKLLLMDRRVCLFVIGGTFIALGGAVSSVALPLFILRVSHNPWLIGVVFVAREIPSTVLAPILGNQIDRMGAYRSTVIGLLLSTFGTGLIPIVKDVPLLIIVCALILGAGWTLLFSTVSLYLPAIVDEQNLDIANSAFRTTSIVGGMIGTALGGALITTELYSLAFWLDATTYIIALVTIILIGKVQLYQEEGRTGSDDDAMSSFRVVWRTLRVDSTLFEMFIIDAAIYFSLGATGVLLPVYVTHEFHGSWFFSIAVLSQNIGELLGGLVAPWVNRKIHDTWLSFSYAAMTLVMAIAYIEIGTWVSVLSVLLMSFLASFALGVLYVLYGTYMQRAVPASIMGRFQTVAAGLSSLFQGTGNVMSGGVASTSPTVGYIITGVVNSVASIGVLLYKRRR